MTPCHSDVPACSDCGAVAWTPVPFGPLRCRCGTAATPAQHEQLVQVLNEAPNAFLLAQREQGDRDRLDAGARALGCSWAITCRRDAEPEGRPL